MRTISRRVCCSRPDVSLSVYSDNADSELAHEQQLQAVDRDVLALPLDKDLDRWRLHVEQVLDEALPDRVEMADSAKDRDEHVEHVELLRLRRTRCVLPRLRAGNEPRLALGVRWPCGCARLGDGNDAANFAS
mgnify:CR=1 FL=1